MLVAMAGELVKIETVLPADGEKHIFENLKFDLHADCDDL